MANIVEAEDNQYLANDEDDWHAVADTKKRKQIQDRLAQRARRRFSSDNLAQ